MAITEENRHRMYQRLEEVLGREEAAVLMEHLPPVGWADVATRRDLDQQGAMTRRDLEHFSEAFDAKLDRAATTLDAKIDRVATSLDAKIDRAATTLDAKIDHVATTLDAKIDHLGGTLRGEWRHDMLQQTYVLVGSMVAIAGAVVAAAKLLW